ncbi:MAG: hypothetical protein HQ526_08285 [Actinobacteria bacterium]|nr:hypothetical protein [Actinomycetota bacterium]
MSRRLVIVFGLLVLVMVSVAIAVLVRTAPQDRQPDPDPSPTSTVPAAPVQNTMLFAVRDDEGLIADSVVLGTVPSSRPTAGSWLSVQPGLSVDINANGTLTLSQRGAAAPVDIATNVANQFGFTVDGAMILDRLAFAALVDGVGGVAVPGGTAIVGEGTDGDPKVLVKPTQRKLFGPAAANYVITLNPNEPQQARMDRFDEVFTQVILKLPGNVDRVRSIVGSLGALSRTSLAPERSAEILLEIQTALTDRAVKSATAPTTVVGTSSAAVFTLNPAASLPTIQSLFGDSILQPGINDALPRVRVYSAGVSNSSVVGTQELLAGERLTMVWGGQKDPETTSKIYIPAESSRPFGERVAVLLGLPTDSVVVRPSQSAGAQAAVLLGPDSTLTKPSPTPSGVQSPPE